MRVGVDYMCFQSSPSKDFFLEVEPPRGEFVTLCWAAFTAATLDIGWPSLASSESTALEVLPNNQSC
jgi:hypothetical protein